MMVVSFTGHRKFDYEASYSTLVECVKRLYNGRSEPLIFLSGMADGFDLAAAEAVLELREEVGGGVELHAIIPYRGHIKSMNEQAQRRYQLVVDCADCVVYLEDRYSHGVFFRRNDYLVEHANKMIAYYDRVSKGGTGYTVKRALRKSIEVENIHPDPQLDLFR
ncbi:MAG: SLOG family protein [Rikenellaceae bacterium]